MSDAVPHTLTVSIPNEANWPLQSIDDLCSLVSRGTAPVYVEHSNILAIGQRCVASFGFAPEFARPHSHRAMHNVLRPEFGDVLLNSTGTGTIGRSIMFQVDDTFIVDGHVTVLRPRLNVTNGHWLNSVLRTSWAQNHLERYCYSGSTNQLELSRTPLRASRIPTPSLAEQHAIAQVLDTVDTAIRETESIVTKLKLIKQGLLHDLLTRGIDENGELRPPRSEAPGLYEHSSLGWMPKEWEVVRLESLLSELGQGWSPDCPVEPAGADEWGVLKTTSIVWDGYNENENKRLPISLKPRPALEVASGDILVTRAGPMSRVGVVAHVSSTRKKLMISDKMYRLRLLKPEVSAYFALALASPYSQDAISRTISGMAESQTNISQSVIRNLSIFRPKPAEQSAIVERVRILDERLAGEGLSLHKLQKQKTGLMDDLLTGRVRVTSLQAQQQ